jgi:hypothetical protein
VGVDPERDERLGIRRGERIHRLSSSLSANNLRTSPETADKTAKGPAPASFFYEVSRLTPSGGAAATLAEAVDGSLERHEALFFSGQTAKARCREHHDRNTRRSFFVAPPQTLYCPGDRRVANSHSRHALQERSALRKGGYRSLLEVRLKDPLSLLIELRA